MYSVSQKHLHFTPLRFSEKYSPTAKIFNYRPRIFALNVAFIVKVRDI